MEIGAENDIWTDGNIQILNSNEKIVSYRLIVMSTWWYIELHPSSYWYSNEQPHKKEK